MITYKFRINTNERWRHAAGARECFRLFFVARGELKINVRQKTSRVRQARTIAALSFLRSALCGSAG